MRDRIRRNTPEGINEKIDHSLLEHLREFSQGSAKKSAKRIEVLDKEWDIERVLEANAAVFSLLGIVMGAASDKKWYLLPVVVGTFLLQHAIQGWCPPLPVFRILGFRTRKEIDEEKYALKALRGDFKSFGRKNMHVEGVFEKAFQAAHKK